MVYLGAGGTTCSSAAPQGPTFFFADGRLPPFEWECVCSDRKVEGGWQGARPSAPTAVSRLLSLSYHTSVEKAVCSWFSHGRASRGLLMGPEVGDPQTHCSFLSSTGEITSQAFHELPRSLLLPGSSLGVSPSPPWAPGRAAPTLSGIASPESPVSPLASPRPLVWGRAQSEH